MEYKLVNIKETKDGYKLKFVSLRSNIEITLINKEDIDNYKVGDRYKIDNVVELLKNSNG